MADNAIMILQNGEKKLVYADMLSKGYQKAEFRCCGQDPEGEPCNCALTFSSGGRVKKPYFYPQTHEKSHIPGCSEAHIGGSKGSARSNQYVRLEECMSAISKKLYAKIPYASGDGDRDGEKNTGKSPKAANSRDNSSGREEKIPRGLLQVLFAANQQNYRDLVIAPNTLEEHLMQKDCAGERLVVGRFSGQAAKVVGAGNNFFFFLVDTKSHGETVKSYFGIQFCNTQMKNNFMARFKEWQNHKQKIYGVILFGSWKSYEKESAKAWYVDYDYGMAAEVVLLTKQDADQVPALLSPDWEG